MNTKLLLLLGAVLGLLLLATLGPGRDQVVPEDPSQLIDSAHFILELNGLPILEEAYTIEFHPADGYLLNSQGSITAGGQTIRLAQQTQYDRNFLPINYQMAAETPSGPQIISAQMGLRGFNMDVRAGMSIQSAKIVDTSNLALLDNNLIGQFAVLLMAIRTESLDRTFTAAIPQALLSLPAHIEGPNTVTFYSGEAEFQGKQFDLHLGDTVISLIEFEGHLIGLRNQTQGTLGYDKNLCPDGIRFETAAGVDEVGDAMERDLTFASNDLTLAGTLRLPLSGDGPYPAALLIHGSGPIDRDGNAINVETGAVVMELDAYRQLAVALSDAGIASLRFDKRGVGESEGDVSLAARADLLDDARAAIEALRAQPEIDASRIILIGHSEGSYLAPVLAVEDETIAGVVLLAGAARPLDAITLWQVESLLKKQGIEGETLEAALAQQNQYIAFVEGSQGEWADYTADSLQADLPWLTPEAANQLKSTPLALSWLREHYLAEPAEVIAQLQQPVLIISGEKDSQVPATEAALLEELLEAAGNQDVTVHVLPDLNHLLRHHPEEPNLTYRHIDEPVDARVTQALSEWIVERFGS
ncbi:MAG: alpha/beta fold hydrolase [Candidatus Atribacteria bacterium]|nr:MAG: alpha/beta fold hydrolase [Candidatus Atribacteria bacterium]